MLQLANSLQPVSQSINASCRSLWWNWIARFVVTYWLNQSLLLDWPWPPPPPPARCLQLGGYGHDDDNVNLDTLPLGFDQRRQLPREKWPPSKSSHEWASESLYESNDNLCPIACWHSTNSGQVICTQKTKDRESSAKCFKPSKVSVFLTLDDDD